MNPEILKMQQDLEKFRQSKMGGPSSTTSAPVMQPSAPVSNAPVSDIDRDLQSYRQSRGSGATSTKSKMEKDPSFLAAMAKGIFTAPTTIVARPFQAAAAIAGASNDQIDEFSQNIPIIGGLIADAPDTMKDVTKDVGRGIQTVALGTGAPIAGGALFGAGASLEQDNDLLSAETAFNVATGGAAGKILQVVGRPLLNASGKVIGTITPQTIKDVAKGGSAAIQKFMQENQLLGGVAAKPSAAIANSLQKVDDVIEGGFSKAGTGAKNAIAAQYPNASIQKHFVKKNQADIVRPTTVNEPKYYKATNVYKDAERRGVKIEDIASRRGVIHDKIAEGGKYNSKESADAIRANVFQVGNDITRPALKALEPETRLIPIPEVRNAMVRQIDDIPDSQITAEAREILKRKILKQYADGSAISRRHPNGMSLTNLHDARIISGKNGKYKPGGTTSDALSAQMAREEGHAYSKLLDSKLPDEFKAMRRANEEDFLLADYLEALHGKKVPEGVTGRAARLFGRAVTATVGGKVGGFPGAILGAQYGDMLFGTFQALPNPLKIKVLNSIKLESPAAYAQLTKLIGDKEMARLTTLALPPGGASTFKPENPRLFATEKGTVTPNKQEAVDMAAVESGVAKRPFTEDPRWQEKVIEAQENLGAYLTPSQMKTILMGNKVKLKVDGKVIDIEADDLPKVFGPDLKNPPEAYIPEDQLPLIDFGPKPKKPKKSLNDIYID